MPTPNKPIHHIRFGAVQAAIWKNQDPDKPPRYNVTVERIYRDADEKWQSTQSFGRDELLVLAKIADLAHTKIHALQAADRTKEAIESNGTAAAVTNASNAR